MRRRFEGRRNGSHAVFTEAALVQQLESRVLLAGTVGLKLNNANDVLITGDRFSNEVRIDVAGSGISVTGLNGTRLSFNNQTVNAGVTVLLTQSNVIPRDLRISTGAGNDIVDVNINSDVDVVGHISVNLGAGNDTLDVNSSAVTTVGGDLKVSGGKGDDLISIQTSGEGEIDVAGSGIIDGNGGNNTIVIGSEEDISVAVDEGDWQTVVDNSATPALMDVRFGSDLKIDTSGGNDRVLLVSVSTGRDVSVNLRGGKGDVIGVNNLSVGGDATVKSAELHALSNLTVKGKSTIRSGDGSDSIAVANATFHGDVDIHLGVRDDVIAIGAGVITKGKVKINGGGGTNLIQSASNVSGATLKRIRQGTVDLNDVIDEVISEFV